MMKKLWFVTPGAFPLDAFTTFGTNVKPNTTTPIGHFGTGLKYAVAIALRLGGSVTLYTGGAEYGFYLEKKEFRGKVFNTVRMRSRKPCTLARRRLFGWKVRLLTEVLQDVRRFAPPRGRGVRQMSRGYRITPCRTGRIFP